MKMTVIIPYTATNDSLRLEAFNNLIKCIEAQKSKEYELIIVEDLRGKSQSNFPGFSKKQGSISKLITVNDPQRRPFNKSWIINIGVKAAIYHNVFVIDADVLFGNTYFERILDFAQIHPMFFHGYNWIVLLPGRDNPITRVSPHQYISSTGGTWFANKNFYFNQLGGMNENYFGYGCEDGDMWSRASYLLNGIPEMNYPLTHQYHHWHEANGANPLNPDRAKLLNYTKNHTKEVIEKLKQIKLGNSNFPTLINIGI